MRSVVVLFLSAAALALPASALGAPVIAAPIPVASTAQGTSTGAETTPAPPLNVASGRAALNAYANYLQAFVKTAADAQQNTEAYVTTIESGCKSDLQPLTDPSYQVNANVQTTLNQLGQEIGDDLSITFDTGTLTPFTKLSTALTRLHWTKISEGGLIVRHFLATQGAALTIAPSNLCQDVQLIEATPQKLPFAAKAFLKEYNKASNVADASLTSFLALLHAYETPNEHQLVTRIANLASQVNKLQQAAIMANATALTAELKST
jgi:hypothetical protein